MDNPHSTARKTTRTATGRPMVPLRGLAAPLRGEAPPTSIIVRPDPLCSSTSSRRSSTASSTYTGLSRSGSQSHSLAYLSRSNSLSRSTSMSRTASSSSTAAAQSHSHRPHTHSHSRSGSLTQSQIRHARTPSMTSVSSLANSPPRNAPLDSEYAERERRAKHARLSLAREPPPFSPSFSQPKTAAPGPSGILQHGPPRPFSMRIDAPWDPPVRP